MSPFVRRSAGWISSSASTMTRMWERNKEVVGGTKKEQWKNTEVDFFTGNLYIRNEKSIALLIVESRYILIVPETYMRLEWNLYKQSGYIKKRWSYEGYRISCRVLLRTHQCAYWRPVERDKDTPPIYTTFSTELQYFIMELFCSNWKAPAYRPFEQLKKIFAKHFRQKRASFFFTKNLCA